MIRTAFFCTALALLIAACQQAEADTVFSNRTTFTDAFSSNTISESFEDEAVDTVNGPANMTFNGFSVSYSGTGLFGVSDNPGPGIGPTDGTQFLRTDSGGTAGITFDFDSPTLSFGVDIRDVDNGFNILFETSSGFSGTAASNGSNGNIQFFGVLADSPFSSVTFQGSSSNTEAAAIAFDQVLIAIPEPSTLGLLIAGLSGLFFRVRS